MWKFCAVYSLRWFWTLWEGKKERRESVLASIASLSRNPNVLLDEDIRRGEDNPRAFALERFD